MKRNKKAQVTIFVIMGVLIVSIILLFIALRENVTPDVAEKKETNTQSIFESCLEEQLNESVSKIISQGGYMENPLNISFKFNGSDKIENISYLCYTIKEYFSCINQEPLLMPHLEREIERNISPQVRTCFDRVAENLQNQGEVVEAEYNGFNVSIVPRKIVVDVYGKITSTKSNVTTIKQGINGEFQSKLYEVTKVVEEIVNQEAEYCNFDFLGFMLLYPEYEIDRISARNSTGIYTVKHKKGAEKFVFAIRSCSFPPSF